MRPLSPKKRLTYLIILSGLFCVSVPLVLLYASGYRYKVGFGIVQTGGIVLSVPYENAVVFLNGQEIGRSGLLNRNFYIDDLAPSAYDVRVAREGARTWYRTLVVEPKIVTGGRAVLLPEEIETILLLRNGSVSSTTRGVSAAAYNAYLDAFSTPATSTAKDRGARDSGEVAVVEDGNVYVQWLKSGTKPPDYFCGRPSYCADIISVEKGKQRAVSAMFFGGGIVYATREGGVYFSEADVRPAPVSVPLYPRARADARVVDGKLIVKDGKEMYEISF